MNSIKKFLNINRKFGILLFCLFVFLVVRSAQALYFDSEQNRYAISTNILGRNRMLSQRIAFLSEQIYDGKIELKPSLEESIKLLDESLHVLINGGIAPSVPHSSTIHRPSSEVLLLLNKSEILWQEYKIEAENFLNVTAENIDRESFTNSLIFLEQNSDAFLKANDDVVNLYVEESERSEALSKKITYIVSAVGIFFLLLSMYTVNSVTRRIRNLKSKIANFNEKEDTTIKIEGFDEISELSLEVSQLVGKVKQEFIEFQNKLNSEKEKLDVAIENQKFRNVMLEDSKLATLNLLEDLNEEKEKLVQKEAELLEAQKIGKFGTFSWNLKTNKVEWSDEAFYIYGLEPTADQTPPPMEEYMKIIHPEDREFAQKSIEDSLTSKEETENVHRVIYKDNSIHWIRVQSKTVFDKDGKAILSQGTFQDITKEKEIDKAKTEFVSLASHQLRTPLSAINWYTEMLLDEDAGKINADQKDYLKEIYNGNKRMVDLVNSLLNVSRIDLGTFAIEPSMNDIIEISDSIVKEMQPLVTEKKINLKTDYAKDIPKLNIDPKLIRIVFQNLVSNAVKYTPDKGDVSIKIKKDKEFLNIEIKDTGYGIPEAQQNKMFTKLFRGDNVREKITDGTGLGLYIVKSILDQSGGSIRFESKENKGTTFFVKIPLSGMKEKQGQKGLS